MPNHFNTSLDKRSFRLKTSATMPFIFKVFKKLMLTPGNGKQKHHLTKNPIYLLRELIGNEDKSCSVSGSLKLTYSKLNPKASGTGKIGLLL